MGAAGSEWTGPRWTLYFLPLEGEFPSLSQRKVRLLFHVLVPAGCLLRVCPSHCHSKFIGQLFSAISPPSEGEQTRQLPTNQYCSFPAGSWLSADPAHCTVTIMASVCFTGDKAAPIVLCHVCPHCGGGHLSVLMLSEPCSHTLPSRL